MYAINANGVPVVIAAQPMPFAQDRYSTMRNDHATLLIIFGSLQVVFGGLSIIFQAVSLGMYEAYSIKIYAPVGYGFWIGIIFIITGSFGIVSGKRRNRCSVVTFIVLSIISAFTTAVLLSLAITNAIFYSRRNPIPNTQIVNTEASNAGIAMESSMAIMAVAEAIVAIWSSVVCCKIGGYCSDYQGPPPMNAPPVQFAMTGQQPYPITNIGYNQQPQPQTVIAQQQMFHPMAYGQQPVYEQYLYDQQKMGTGYQKLNTHLGSSDYNAGKRSSDKNCDNDGIYDEIIE